MKKVLVVIIALLIVFSFKQLSYAGDRTREEREAEFQKRIDEMNRQSNLVNAQIKAINRGADDKRVKAREILKNQSESMANIKSTFNKDPISSAKTMAAASIMVSDLAGIYWNESVGLGKKAYSYAANVMAESSVMLGKAACEMLIDSGKHAEKAGDKQLAKDLYRKIVIEYQGQTYKGFVKMAEFALEDLKCNN